MRIGVDARYAFRRQPRGIGRYLQALLAAYRALGVRDTFVLFVDAQADLTAFGDLPADCALVRLPGRNPLRFEEWELPRHARRHRLDVLHLPANYGRVVPGVPTVFTVHDLIEFRRFEFSSHPLPLRHRVGRAVRIRRLPRELHRARAVVAPSLWAADDIERRLGVPRSRIRVIPHGCFEDVRTGPPRAEALSRLRAQGLAVPERFLLALDAVDARKNAALVRAAFPRVKARLPDVGLVTVGHEHREGVTLEAGEIRAGYVDRPTLCLLYRAASLFVFGSLQEGFGFPVLEAMASATPVVALRASSVPEVGGDAVLYVDESDPGKLADLVLQVLGDPDLAADLALRGEARSQVFTWEQSAREHHRCLVEAAGS